VRRNPAPQAEVMMLFTAIFHAAVAPEIIGAREEPELIWVNWSSFPHPLLPAEGAVALACPLSEINICLEGDCPAMAAP
jgi:hypothetical protein